MRKSLSFIAFAGLCSLSSLSLAATSSPVTPASRPHSAVVAKTSGKPAAQATATKASKSNDEARYTSKEQQSPNAENYKGGDTVVIGASAATAILAVLLLIILI
jgi:hypothetical protein